MEKFDFLKLFNEDPCTQTIIDSLNLSVNKEKFFLDNLNGSLKLSGKDNLTRFFDLLFVYSFIFYYKIQKFQ